MDVNPHYKRQIQTLLESVSPAQRKLYKIIEDHPGLNIREVAKKKNCTESTAKHHLRALLRAGLIIGEWDGRSVRHFLPHHHKIPEVRIHVLLSQKRTRYVFDYLANHDTNSMSINKIATNLDIPFNSLIRILRRMEKENLISLEKEGGRYRRGLKKLDSFDRVNSLPNVLDP